MSSHSFRQPEEQGGNVIGSKCCSESWEEAYSRFETPEEEIRKFMRRLVDLGAKEWPADASILSLFCGRGSELHALTRLGFTRIEGVDLSPSLLAQYDGPAVCHVADCRSLPYDDESKDVIIVQGGLHHLPLLPDDLDQVLREVQRVLKPTGRFGVVEPWRTPFLQFVHFVCSSRLARKTWSKFDAFAVMYENERTTYDRWLSEPALIRRTLHTRFTPIQHVESWGKLRFLARKRDTSHQPVTTGQALTT